MHPRDHAPLPDVLTDTSSRSDAPASSPGAGHLPPAVTEAVGFLVDRAKVDRKGVFWTVGAQLRQTNPALFENTLGFGTPGILLTLLEYYRRTQQPEIADLLPGAPAHKLLCHRLDLIADNLGNLTDAQGRSIPIVFRAWHQQNGEHYWWCRSRCTVAEYARLFRFTVSYLRDVRLVRNFLYAYAPGAWEPAFANLVEYYPGDEWVDLVGLDWFGDDSATKRIELLRLTAELVNFTEARGKAAALTELGYDNGQGGRGLAFCPDPLWLRNGLLGPLLAHPVARRLAFACFWRNEAYNPAVYNLPPPGTPHADCLAGLADEPALIFATPADAADQNPSRADTALPVHA